MKQWKIWVNGCEAVDHGSHVDGFALALQEQAWAPAVAMLHIVAEDPRFASPTRDRFVSDPARDATRESLAGPLRAFLAERRLPR